MSDSAVVVNNVSKKFLVYHEKRNSMFETAMSLLQRKGTSEILEALDDISFNVKYGEIFGIIGRNGGGKTTLLRIISKIYSADSGTVDVKGKLLPVLALGLGFHPEFTAISNIYQSSILLGIKKEEIAKKIPDILKFAELEKFADTKINNYSSGMQLRLAFATAVFVDPDILILDEVLAVGDLEFQKKCHDTIMSFKKRGKAIIFVSHDMNSIKNFCDTVMFLKDGKVGNIGTPEESITAYVDYLAETK